VQENDRNDCAVMSRYTSYTIKINVFFHIYFTIVWFYTYADPTKIKHQCSPMRLSKIQITVIIILSKKRKIQT